MTERTLLIRTGRTIQQDWFDERTGLVREAAFTRRVEELDHRPCDRENRR